MLSGGLKFCRTYWIATDKTDRRVKLNQFSQIDSREPLRLSLVHAGGDKAQGRGIGMVNCVWVLDVALHGQGDA